MRKYQDLLAEVKGLEKDIQDHEAKLQEAQVRIEAEKATIDNLSNRFKEVVFDGEEKAIREIENQAMRAQAGLKRDQALVVAVKERLEALNKKLTEAQGERDKAFSELAGKRISDKVKAFDRTAREMRGIICWLMAAHNILREVGHAEIYREAVGEGYTVLPSARIPILSEFDPQIFRYYPFNHPSAEILKAVEKEIIGG